MESIAPTDGPYVVFEGKKLLDFSSCDFLGLAQHPEVKKGAIKYALKYGVGSAPRSTPQLEVETKLAHYLGKEAALLFSSESELYAQLEKLGAATFLTDTESSSSSKKTQMKSRALKVADDRYLFGMRSGNGFGSLGDFETICGALLCGSGAFIAGSKKQLASLSPGVMNFPTLGALDCALSFIPELEAERKMVQKHKTWLLKQLSDFEVTALNSPRIIFTSDEADAIRKFFLQEQIYLAPSQDGALYIALTALHTPDDLDQLGFTLKKLAATDLARAMQSLTPTP